jgi:hypothetical protein
MHSLPHETWLGSLCLVFRVSLVSLVSLVPLVSLVSLVSLLWHLPFSGAVGPLLVLTCLVCPVLYNVRRTFSREIYTEGEVIIEGERIKIKARGDGGNKHQVDERTTVNEAEK